MTGTQSSSRGRQAPVSGASRTMLGVVFIYIENGGLRPRQWVGVTGKRKRKLHSSFRRGVYVYGEHDELKWQIEISSSR